MSFDPTSIYLNSPGSGIGGNPGHGGYVPNQTDAVLGSLKSQQDAKMTAWLLQSDKRAQHAAHMASGIIAGSNSAEWMRSNGKAASMVAGMAINSNLVAPIMGGSILDMYSGVNTGLASGGRFEMSTGGTRGYHSGAGYVNDQMSRVSLDRMQDHFYTDTGGARLRRTSGLNRSEIGQVASLIGQGGGFAGMTSGELRTVGSESERQSMMAAAKRSGNSSLQKDLQSLEGEDFNKGLSVFDMDQGTSRAVNEKIEAGAKAMSAMKDIFGSRPFLELSQYAKDLTGMDISSVGGSQEIFAKVARMKVMAASAGMSVGAVSREQAAMGTALGGGSFGSFAAEDIFRRTQGAINASNEYAVIQGEKGRYVATHSREEVNDINVQGAAALARENPEMAGALYALHKSEGMDPTNQGRIREAIAGVNSVTGATSSERRSNLKEARNKLNEAVRTATGQTATGYIDAIGYDNVIENLGPAAGKELSKFTSGEDQARIKLNAREVMGELNNKRTKGGDFMADVFTTMTAKNQSAITKALMGGNAAEARSVIENSELDDKTKKQMIASLEDGVKEGGLSISAKKMDMMAESSILASNNRTEDGIINRRIELATWSGQNALGTDIKVDKDLFRNLASGMMPGEQVGMHRAMGGLIAQGKATNLGKANKDGGHNLTDVEIKKMLDGPGGKAFESAFGLAGMSPDKKVAFMKAKMSTAGGYMEFLNASETAGHGVALGSISGDTYYADKSDMDDIAPKISASARTAMYTELYGPLESGENGDLFNSDGTSVEKRVSQDINKFAKGLTGKDARNLEENLKYGLGKDLLTLMKHDSQTVIGAIDTNIMEAKKYGYNDQAKSLENIKKRLVRGDTEVSKDTQMVELLTRIAITLEDL